MKHPRLWIRDQPCQRGRTRAARPRCRRRRRPSSRAPRRPPRRRSASRRRTARARTRPSGRSRTRCRHRRSRSRSAGRCAGRCRGPSSRRGRRRDRARGARRRRRSDRRSRGRRAAARGSRRPRPRRAPAGPVRSPASSHSESPMSWPSARKNGKHIAPPIRIVSARSRNASRTPILSVTFAPPTIATSGRAGSSRIARSVVTSRSSSRPAADGQQVRDRLGRRMCAVRGAERVVDVDVGQRGVAAGEADVVGGLPRVEAHVLEHHDVAVGNASRSAASGISVDSSSAARCRDRRQRQRRVDTLRAPEVRGEHEPRAPAAQLVAASAARRGSARRR